MSPIFIEFMIVAVLSMVITFVLFHWLESKAVATSPFLGGTIKYGGALAGFVLIFWLLSYIYDNSFSSRIKTGIQLEGAYNISQWRPGGVAKVGSATISQRIGDPEFYVVGEIENELGPPSISFHTISGVIKEERLVWLFENDRREMGIGLGDIRSDQEFIMTCGDVLGNELDAGIKGNLIFTKRKEALKAKKEEIGAVYAYSRSVSLSSATHFRSRALTASELPGYPGPYGLVHLLHGRRSILRPMAQEAQEIPKRIAALGLKHNPALLVGLKHDPVSFPHIHRSR